MTWNRSEDGNILPEVKHHRVAETCDGKRDRLQAQLLVDLATKHCLNQEVDRPTHAVEVLDLVFSNNPDIVTAPSEEDWPQFTDHRIVSVQTSFRLSRDTTESEEQHLCHTGERYKSLDFNKAPWEKVREDLAQVDWSEVTELAKSSPTSALTRFHEKVLDILEKNVPKRTIRTDLRCID